MDFRKLNDYYIVFAENINIATFLNSYPEFYMGYSVLITWLDSTKAQEVVSIQRLQDKNINYKFIDKYLFFTSSDFNSLLKIYVDSPYSVFTHFDEIYLFHGIIPSIVPNSRFTSDGCFFNSDIPAAFFETMDSLGAQRYLSNGCGLNLASRTPINIEKIIDIEAKYLRETPLPRIYKRKGQSPNRDRA